ncbi:MAG: hypothetical protein MSIBF_04875 [Candidatus Altiarchaeales archaeon IMC4]|nr:MAG: hypothetical protein MSIBF_04875 [Candidatus Altiarchaeales archaeon IMC4]
MPLEFPGAMVERYSKLTKWNKLRERLLVPSRKSIRVNTLKNDVDEVFDELAPDWNLAPVPWCPEGFWISDKKGERKDIGNIPLHQTGGFYIQEAASMIPAIVLDPKPYEMILDICASPGGKTMQIAQYMNNTGRIVANDIREDRVAILERSIERMGAKNCEVTMKPGQQFKDMRFDRILVDAPCSGTGTMRGCPDDIKNWNPDVSKRISYTQKSLLHHAYCVLKKGGVMVYSTCSMEPEENEGVVDWLLKRHKKTELETAGIRGLKTSPPAMEFEGEKYDERVSLCLRIWPQDNDTDGFFVAKIKKPRKG